MSSHFKRLPKPKISCFWSLMDIQSPLMSFSVWTYFFPQFNHTGQGSICSQAIMLITDGAVDTYDTIFAKYNWPDRKVSRCWWRPCSATCGESVLHCNLQIVHGQVPHVDLILWWPVVSQPCVFWLTKTEYYGFSCFQSETSLAERRNPWRHVQCVQWKDSLWSMLLSLMDSASLCFPWSQGCVLDPASIEWWRQPWWPCSHLLYVSMFLSFLPWALITIQNLLSIPQCCSSLLSKLVCSLFKFFLWFPS